MGRGRAKRRQRSVGLVRSRGDIQAVARLAALDAEGLRGEALDPQRRAVYEAELGGPPTGRHFKNLIEVQAFADQVVFADWWRARFPHCPSVLVTEITEGSHGFSGPLGGGVRGSYLSLPQGGLYVRYLMHELAHCALGPGTSPHGPEFTRAYLDLVEESMSRNAAIELARSFRKKEVAINPRVSLNAWSHSYFGRSIGGER